MQLLNRKPLHLALILAVGLIVYSNTLNAPFYWDDSNFTDSPLIKSFDYFIHPEKAKGFLGYGGFLSRYVGYFTFALNYRINGLDVTGYHLVNIAIHLITALLVYRLVSLTLKTPFFTEGRDHAATDARTGFIALLSALLFVAHPIQTQAVTYIVQRFASLAALFYLLALTNYLKGRLVLAGSPTPPTLLPPEGESREGGSRRPLAAAGWFAAALVSALLALKTKEIAYTLPITVLLFEMLLFTRDSRKRTLALGLAVLPVVGLIATKVTGGSLAELATQLDRATRLQTDMSRWDYLATQCWVVLTYLRLLLLPVGQRLDYDYQLYDSFFYPEVIVSGLLLLALVAAACYFLRRSRAREDEGAVLYRVIALGIFWFFVTLSIESSLIPIVDVIFEHRVYLPSVGIFMALSAWLSLIGGREDSLPGWPGVKVAAGCLAALVILCGAAYSRNGLWGDEVAFWEDNAWKTPQKSRVYVNLARALEQRGEAEEAKVAYGTALKLDPKQTDTLLNMGLMDVQNGRLDQALQQFRAALVIDPKLIEAHNNIGMIYGMQSRLDEALNEFQQVVRLDPTLAAPHNNIAFLYAQQKRNDEALAEYAKCLALDPDYEKAYVNRGMLLKSMGRTAEARADFRRALEINPESAEAALQLRSVDQ